MTNVNQYGWKALVGSAVGYAMDGFDLLILGFMLSAISADLNLTPAPVSYTHLKNVLKENGDKYKE